MTTQLSPLLLIAAIKHVTTQDVRLNNDITDENRRLEQKLIEC